MLVSLTADGDEIQVDILEGPQHRFGGGVVGGSRRITGKQAGQLLAALGQISASDMLDQFCALRDAFRGRWPSMG